MMFFPFFLSYDKAGICVTVLVFGCAVLNVCTSFYVSNHLLSIQSWDIWSEMFVFVCLWALGWVSCGRQLYSWETAAGETLIFKHYCCVTAQKIILIILSIVIKLSCLQRAGDLSRMLSACWDWVQLLPTFRIGWVDGWMDFVWVTCMVSCCYPHHWTQSGSLITGFACPPLVVCLGEAAFSTSKAVFLIPCIFAFSLWTSYSWVFFFPFLTIQCLLFLQHNNSHRVGAAASTVAREMVAGVTHIWQLLLLWVHIAAELWELTVEIGSTLLAALGSTRDLKWVKSPQDPG